MIFKRHYSTSSDADVGTLYADRNLINRRNVTADVHSNWANNKAFALLEIKARIIAAAMEVLGMGTMDDEPTHYPITEALRHADALPRRLYLYKLGSQVVDKFAMDGNALVELVDSILSVQEHENLINNQQLTPEGRFPCRSPGCSKSFKYDGKRRRDHELTHDPPPAVPEQSSQTTFSDAPKKAVEDDVKCDDAFNYNCSFLNQGLLLMNFLDATSEGDGERTLRSWKFFLLHFKEEKSTQSKYALEALYLLFQVYALLPPDQAHKLVWNRTINNKGGLGHNVALDLDLEHDNNYLKQSIRNLGANVTPEAVLRISRSQKVTSQILLNLDKECKVKPKSGRHVSADYTKDLKTVVKAIAEERVFNYNPGRQYTCFQNFPRDSLSRLDCSKLFQWINRHKKNIELARKAR